MGGISWKNKAGTIKAGTAKEIIHELPKGLLKWYDFKQSSTILYIGTGEDSLAELLAEQSLELVCASCELTCDGDWQREQRRRQQKQSGEQSASEQDSLEQEGIFDYIVSVETLEQELQPGELLAVWKKLLKPDGRLLLGMNNRFGIRYFCGDRDRYTGRNFDGIEGYRRAYSKREDVFCGRCYSRAELEKMLRDAGWHCFQFFSVLSDLKNPSLIYAEDYLPNEDLATRVFPTYNYPDTVFLEEESLYSSLAENGMFHLTANAYLIECSLNGEMSDVKHVTGSMERGREYAVFTIIHKSGTVEKRAAYPEGRERLERLAEHSRDLEAHGISVVKSQMEHGTLVMPYIEAKVGQVYLKQLLQADVDKFLQEMDHFRELILKSSEVVEPDAEDGKGIILRRGYLDMVPLNSFYIDGTFVFYDQEFCEENYPANVLITRMITTFYGGNPELLKILPMNELLNRYGLMPNLELWGKMAWDFLAKLRNEKVLRSYHEMCRRNGEEVNSNRQRMNYSEGDYQRLFVDIFRNADTRKLILFGSGLFAKKFIDLYRQDYPVYAIVDNSQEKWGQELEGITIQSPDILRELAPREYKVLICIKNYLSVMKQLDAIGVTEYSIFDSHKDYPRKRRPIVQTQGTAGEKSVPKKYHTGYIAGVFDLFHVGHLNMFKRAKEQCDYLIVGVVSDEGVRKFKEVEPFIPFEERIEMVRSCRYVDEAVEIPLNFGGTRDAFRLYHFDCQFSGSDYVDNPDWLAEKAFLEKHGAEMVFFPYTESTSSTKIKKLIERGLL